jgi:hypothetical protein
MRTLPHWLTDSLVSRMLRRAWPVRTALVHRDGLGFNLGPRVSLSTVSHCLDGKAAGPRQSLPEGVEFHSRWRTSEFSPQYAHLHSRDQNLPAI